MIAMPAGWDKGGGYGVMIAMPAGWDKSGGYGVMIVMQIKVVVMVSW